MGSTYLTVAERVQRGKQARNSAPRSSHGAFKAQDRDPIELLEGQARTRVPELVPIRYERMLVSPFTFFRGGALLMAHDLAGTPDTGITVQCCGDAHLSNFGLFGSAERRLVFDINDFDETLPGPWEWDVKRLATSVLIAARDNEFGVRDQERAVLATVRQYREVMRELAAVGNLDVWYARIDVDELTAVEADARNARFRKQVDRTVAKARSRDNVQALSKLTTVVDGEVRIIDQSPLMVPAELMFSGVPREELLALLEPLLGEYRDSLEPRVQSLYDQFELADFARRVVGVGSVGTRAWVALLLGRDPTDPLFIQVKEAQPSVLERYVGASAYPHHGQRVVFGQRAMQQSSDVFLGWLSAPDTADGELRDFYGRQLRDWKGSANVEQLDGDGLERYGRLCGWALAHAHARTGDRIALAAYLGGGSRFERAILGFAIEYAAQNERDYAALADAVADGRISAGPAT